MHSSTAAFDVDTLQVAGLRARGLSWNEIARELGIGKGTAQRAFDSLPKTHRRNSFTNSRSTGLTPKKNGPCKAARNHFHLRSLDGRCREIQ
jgi:hypothetical protein